MSIRDLRRRKGLTQVKLSDECGLSSKRISDYENGLYDVGDMRVRTALKLMDALGTRDVRDLFNERPD